MPGTDGPLDPDDLHPGAPDTVALRRRVLLTAVVTLVLFVACVVVLDALRAPALAVLPLAALLWLSVVRPLMRPVREAVALRRRLAYLAWAEARESGGDGGPP